MAESHNLLALVYDVLLYQRLEVILQRSLLEVEILTIGFGRSYITPSERPSIDDNTKSIAISECRVKLINAKTLVCGGGVLLGNSRFAGPNSFSYNTNQFSNPRAGARYGSPHRPPLPTGPPNSSRRLSDKI
ncbi:hypothetical protein QTP88_012610 [Uroleucon formosanum]